MTLLRRRAALDAWLAHAEALLPGPDRPWTEGPELRPAPPERERTGAAPGGPGATPSGLGWPGTGP